MSVGRAPIAGSDEQLIEGRWALGIVSGQNWLATSGIAAAGTNHATSFQLPSGYALMEVDTVGSGAGVSLPPAVAGTSIMIYNNGASTLTIYPSIANNRALATPAQDTINNATSVTLAQHVSAILFCAKTGIWANK